MKIASIIAFGFFQSVFSAAVPLEKREAEPDLVGALQRANADNVPPEKRILGSDIIGAVNQVNDGVKNLDSAVENVTSADLTAFLAVNTAASDLTTTIQSAQATVEGAQPLGLVGSLGVELASNSLVKSVQKLSNDLISIKSFASEAGVQATVLSTLQGQKTTSDAFAAALTDKVPSLLRPIAGISTKEIDEALDKAIDAYSS